MIPTEDRLDIVDLTIRYATGIDQRDWPLFRTVFTEDCALDYGEIGSWNGVDAVTDFMERTHAGAGLTMHRISNQTISVDGDRGGVRSYVDVWIMFLNSKSGVNALGFYDDVVIRTATGWRIAERRFTPMRIAPFTDLQ